jgi:hypothetical protein
MWFYMLNSRILVFLCLLCLGAVDGFGDRKTGMSCGTLRDLKLQQPPKRVLLVPLLSREPHTTESRRWSEQPARQLKSFYQNRFNTTVQQLQDVWSWSDYYRQIEQLMKQSQTFDRMIFISHGGFDGPVLANAGYVEELQLSEGKSKLLMRSEAQPGLMNEISIAYVNGENRTFSDYLALHRSDLASMKFNDIWQQLKGLEKQLQPLDNACFQRYCSADKLTVMVDEHRTYQLYLCELICRKSLFELKTSVEISAERFFHFTKSLSSLVTSDGLIFFGACNPGTKAPKNLLEPDETELLINSNLAGGPHQSYVHLVSKATGRITAGPIGESSADDIVNRMVKFENHRHQHNLCLVSP